MPRWCRAISEKSPRDPKGPARPAPATGGNSPGTGLGTNTYTNTTGAGRQTVHSTLSSWLHSCTSDYVNEAVITSARGDPATQAGGCLMLINGFTQERSQAPAQGVVIQKG